MIRHSVNEEELDIPAVSAHGVRSRKLSNALKGIRWVTNIYHLELLRASEGTLSCWSRSHLQFLAPTPIIAEYLSQHDEKACCTDPT
jgi:hypothetical protein